MTTKLINRVRMSVASAPGTGQIVVNTAAVGFQSFTSAGLNDGDETPYLLEDGSPVGSVWEIGLGTWHSNGTFSRDTITQSSLGGTTPISATASTVISATFRASDLSPPSNPSLSTLSDVAITSLSTNQSLKWNGSDWINYTPSVGSTTFAGLTDVSLTSLTDGDVATWDAGSSKWKNKPAAGGGGARMTPTVVQYGTIQQSSTGAASITLGAAPTAGNLLVFMGNGGNSNISGTLIPGIALSTFDYSAVNDISIAPATLACSFGYRVVRPGDSATVSIGTVGNSGYTLNGVLVEVANADISAMVDLLVKRNNGVVGGSFSDGSLSLDGALQLLFVGGGNGTMTISTPSSCTFGPTTNNSGSMAFNHAVAADDYVNLAGSISSGIYAYDILITIPGLLT